MKTLFTAHLPLVAKEHWKNDVLIQRRVWRQLTFLATRNCLDDLPNIALALDI